MVKFEETLCSQPSALELSETAMPFLVQRYVEHYNNIRLNNAIGYITPKDMLAGRQLNFRADRVASEGDTLRIAGGPEVLWVK